MAMAGIKKLHKKQRRKELLFLKDECELGVHIQESPSLHLLISNGGLGNGISRRVLTEILSTRHLYMPLGKDYAFATYSSHDKSAAIVDSVNGVCIQDVEAISQFLPPSLLKGPPLHLYLSYIKEVPEVVAMGTSEGATPSLPPGLMLIHEFVSSAEEDELMSLLHSTHMPHCNLKHRQVFHYGYEFNYKTNHVDHTSPLSGEFPLQIKDLISRMLCCDHIHHYPNQITVNRYPPSAGIPPHVDTHSAFMDEIISLSLGSQVVMDFRKTSVNEGSKVEEKVPVLLPRRSLLVMNGASRYLWTHGIPARTFDEVPCDPTDLCPPVEATSFTAVARATRISLTFRTLQCPPTCSCAFPEHCDYQQQLLT